MNSAEAFRKAERARRSRHPVSLEQRMHLERLSRAAGVVMPRVHNSKQATDAITRLEKGLRQPELEGFGAVGGR